jgi:TcpE family
MSNRTYRKLWQQRPALTSLGNFKFPFGFRITLDGMLAFLICLIPARFLQPMISGLSAAVTGRPLSKPLVLFVLAATGAWASTKIDPDGKPLPVFFLDVVAYLLRPHGTNGWTPIRIRKKPMNVTLNAKCIIRRTPPQD